MARYVFDLADWDRSGWVVPLGSAGDPGNPHYADQAEAWSQVRLYPMTYSWDAIEAEATTRPLVWKLEGLSDADVRRPMTETATNLIGLVKHLTMLEAN